MEILILWSILKVQAFFWCFSLYCAIRKMKPSGGAKSYRGFTRRGTHQVSTINQVSSINLYFPYTIHKHAPIHTQFSPPLGFLFVWCGIEENNNKRCFLIYFISEFKISTECVLIYLSLSFTYLVLWYELNKKVTGHFVVFSNTALCKQETNMAVASMTCKIGLMIWSYMKTLYSEENITQTPQHASTILFSDEKTSLAWFVF